MPNQQVQVRDKTTGQTQVISLDDLQSALASGKYETYEGSNVNASELGTNVRLEPKTASATLSTGNTDYVAPEDIALGQGKERQKDALQSFENKALTFAEGISDSLSFGLAHERSDKADLRRELNSGSAFAGEMAGISLGLFAGPESALAHLGENAGKSVARTVLGESGVVGKLGARALGEAGANAAITAAQATGHQVWDSLLQDKPIAVEAIAHETGLAGLLGTGFGVAGGIFSKGISRGAVEKGMGLDEFVPKAIDTFDTSTNEIRHALRQHETRIGALKEASDSGLIPKNFMADRAEKLAAAQEAEAKLAKMGNAKYALNASPKEAYRWQQATEDFHAKVQELDEVMTPKIQELGLRQQELGTPVQGPISPPPDSVPLEPGYTSEEAVGLNERMGRSSELQAKYKEIYGRDWEPVGKEQGHNEQSSEPSLSDLHKNLEDLGHKDVRNLSKTETYKKYEEIYGKDWEERLLNKPKSEVTPTSELKTNAGRKPSSRITSIDETARGKLNDLGYYHYEIDRMSPESASHAIENNVRSQELVGVNNPDIHYAPEAEMQQNASAFKDVVNNQSARVNAKTNVFKDKEYFKTKEFKPGEDQLRTGEYSKPVTDTQVVSELETPKPQTKPETSVPVSENQIVGERNLAHENMGKLKNDANLVKNTKFKKLIDDWYHDSKRVFMGSPASRAISNIDRHLGDLKVGANGRMDAAGALGFARSKGFGESSTEIGARFQQAWALNNMAKDVAKIARSPVGRGLDNKSVLAKGLGYAKRRIGGKIGAGVGGALLGHELAGDESGYWIGAALASGYIGFGGQVATSISKISNMITVAGEALLKGSRKTIATQLTRAAITKNNAWSYSQKGPIEDPIKRIQEIHQVASNPESVVHQIKNNSGDLALIHPEVLDLLIKAAQNKMHSLSIRAPKIVMDRLGNPLQPATGIMRRFLEYENSLNDLRSALENIASGNVTKDLADGLRDGWPAFQGKLANTLLNDPEALRKLPQNQLRAIENITGIDLTGHTDGQYLSRQTGAWSDAGQATASKNESIGKPQSFKINDKKVPEAKPTVNQNTNGRAPGN